jgi:hypothetical protein
MTPALRTLSLAIFLTAATAAHSQSAPAAGANPLDRGDRGALSARNAMNGTPLGNNGNQLSRPVARFGPVTPVPEPSQWAMLLAGLGVVAWIVRRRSNRD